MSLASIADLASSSSSDEDETAAQSSSCSDSESESDENDSESALSSVPDAGNSEISSLPLPAEFRQPAKRRIESSKPIQKKKRAVEHTDGTFPSHLYLEVPANGDVDAMCLSLVAAATEACKKLLSQSGSAPEPPRNNTDTCAGATIQPIEKTNRHISISRPFYLQKHHIRDFVQSVRDAVASQPCFSFALDNIGVVLPNATRQLGFLAVPVTIGQEEISALIEAVDSPLNEFNQEKYYKERLVHMSIASSSHQAFVAMAAKRTSVELAPSQRQPLPLLRVNHVSCKIGMKVYTFPLKSL